MVRRPYQNGRQIGNPRFKITRFLHLFHLCHCRRFLSHLPRPRLHTLDQRHVHHQKTQRVRSLAGRSANSSFPFIITKTIPMEFQHISSGQDFRVPVIYQSYCATFPPDEQRSHEQFLKLFTNPLVKINALLDDHQHIGYLILWELSHYTYIEHFEVFPEFRSRKYGSAIMTSLRKQYPKIVLEAEPENLDETAQRRIGFYQRNGLTVIDKTYVQPSYGEGKNPINLWLLANWLPENTVHIKEELYDVVYP